MARRAARVPADLTAGRERPAYRVIADVIRASIAAGRIRPGTILLEGPLAELFGCSRSPVKQALALLSREKQLSRFDGRGVVVGQAGPEQLKRVPIGAAELGLAPRQASLQRLPAWMRIYDDVERDLVLSVPFGAARLNEIKFASHYGVGRTAARDVLRELQAVGLLEQDHRQWRLAGLDDARVDELFDLRDLLEPALIERAARHLPPDILQRMEASLEAAAEAYPDVTTPELDDLEHDLHVTCLARAESPELLTALKRSRAVLITAKYMLGRSVPLELPEPFLAEHLAIIQALRRRDGAEAARAMARHLKAARPKVQGRLAWYRRHVARPALPYLLPPS